MNKIIIYFWQHDPGMFTHLAEGVLGRFSLDIRIDVLQIVFMLLSLDSLNMIQYSYIQCLYF